MMAGKVFKRFVALGLCSAMVGGSALAANTVYRTIQVQYSGIKLVVDGATVIPKDANGTTVEPFIYNGTTYLPVRAVGNAIGKQVTWDGSSKTVYLGDTPNSWKWLMSLCPPYETYSINKDDPTFKMDGQTYTHGFYAYPDFVDRWALFNLNGQYRTLSCDIGHLEGYSGNDTQVEIYLDGDLSQVIDIPKEALAKHFDIPLHNALQMKIVVNTATGFGNCVLS